MNEIYPSLVGDPSLLPKLLHRGLERFRRPFVIRYPLISPRIREERLVKILRQVPSILIHHRPHCADHAPESTVLHSGCQVQAFVNDASLRHLGSVTSRQKCEFGSGQIRANDLEKGKALLFVKLESSLEWFIRLKSPVARKVDKSVVLKGVENRSGCGRS